MTTKAFAPSEAVTFTNTLNEPSSASVSELEPNLEEAQLFLDQLGPGEEFTFQTFSDRKKGKGSDPLAATFHGSLDQHGGSLVDINRQGGGAFVMINEGDGIRHDGAKTCRTNANVKRIRALFVDLDESPLDPVRRCDLQPSIIVESSADKYHAYWLVSDWPLEEFRPTQKELAVRFGGDPSVTDLARVLRLPGFFHQKAEPFMSRVIFPKRNEQ